MMMLGRNIKQIADWIMGWIDSPATCKNEKCHTLNAQEVAA
jgi:hypothetical protein